MRVLPLRCRSGRLARLNNGGGFGRRAGRSDGRLCDLRQPPAEESDGAGGRYRHQQPGAPAGAWPPPLTLVRDAIAGRLERRRELVKHIAPALIIISSCLERKLLEERFLIDLKEGASASHIYSVA